MLPALGVLFITCCFALLYANKSIQLTPFDLEMSYFRNNKLHEEKRLKRIENAIVKKLSGFMATTKPIPEGVSAVMPMLVCRDVYAEIDFCKTSFNALEMVSRPGPDGKVAHAALTINGAMIMIEAEWPTLQSRSPQLDGSSPVIIYVYVEDADATIEKAVAVGAKILLPAKNQFWGDRTGRIMDPQGHVWTISSRIEETTSSERQERWSKIVNR